MTLGMPTIGKNSESIEYLHWEGNPPKDEFFWLTAINKATLVLNHRIGLISAQNAKKWARALQEVEEEASVSGSHRPKTVLHFEPKLVAKCGWEITAMHAGRSSQDMHCTYQKAILRDEVLNIAEAIGEVLNNLLELCKQNTDTYLPAYTNGVAAQPETLAHIWLAHFSGFLRDLESLETWFEKHNYCPMGATVLGGTSWPLDRKGMSSYLGFKAPVYNTYDATQIAATDAPLELSLALVSPMLHVVQFIQDVMTQYAQPRPWILVGSTYASSAMPQKRNPGSLIDVRRDANTVLGNLTNIIFRAHSLPPGMYDAKDSMLNASTVREACFVLTSFAAVLKMLQINKKRALEELDLDWTATQELADTLMRKYSIPFRIGHHIASQMTTFGRSNELRPSNFPYEKVCEIYQQTLEKMEMKEHPTEFPLTEEEFRSVLNPISIVNRRNVLGACQPGEVSLMLKKADADLAEHKLWKTEQSRGIKDALERCQRDFNALMES
ncbi:lyase family protein [Turicimonas muris]|uniref:lyase family protein n=1 Tax=Turicimonas muris TaxID=1796652 RepID=UPI00267492A3|nr:lyase family protein [Turicimonas muris]MBS4768608.1 argininosuccinate lyase [Burkholderiales bacterium]